MENQMVGRHISFAGRGEGNEVDAGTVVPVEITDLNAGTVELAFTDGKIRHYISVNASDLITMMHKFGRKAE